MAGAHRSAAVGRQLPSTYHPTMPLSDPQPPREPEIEALGRAAHGFLWLLRRVFWIAGAIFAGYGAARCGNAEWTFHTPYTNTAQVHGFTWLCVGLPLLARCDWLFGRTRWLALAIAAALWFGPGVMQDDHTFGFILRIFATVVAYATLLVWRTVWRLTERTDAPAS